MASLFSVQSSCQSEPTHFKNGHFFYCRRVESIALQILLKLPTSHSG